MDPLSISASIEALLGVTSTVIQYVNAVKGAAEDRRMILSQLASVSGILYSLQEQADQARKKDDQWSSTFQSLGVPEGPLHQIRRALERLSSKLDPPATPMKKLGKAIVWPFQREEIREILASIERQKALLNLARQNDHIKLSKAIEHDVTITRDEVGEVAKGVSRIEMNQMTNEHLKIIKWLDSPDPSTNYNKALRDRNPKTGSWFIESPAYADWKSSRSSFVWLYGVPGCGKTILSSTILQNILDQHPKPNSAVLFFYFDFNDAEKQQHEKMMRSLICQLSKYCENSALNDLYSLCSNGTWQPTEEALLNTLRQILTSLGDAYIILDALDECVERDKLLTDLEQIVSWEDTSLHVLATSRKELDIEEALTPLSDYRIGIQSKIVNADIRTYVHDRLQVDRRLKRWQKSPKVQLEIEDTLTRKADGMFQWVVCQLDLLGDCLHLPHLRQALVSFPKTLDDTYARILCDIDKRYNHYTEYILRILQWLAFSARPLQLKELAEVIAIDVNETPRFDPERRLPNPRDILTICSSLITLTKNASHDLDKETSTNDSVETFDSEGYVRLAHFSVKEYLVSDRINHGMAAHYAIREIQSHGNIAEDCIAYLLQFDEPDSLTYETLQLSPLADYAAKFWPIHTRHAEKGPIETTFIMSMELLMSKRESLLNWVRIADPDHYGRGVWHRALDHLASPLYYASLVGLFEPVKMLVEKNMDVNAKGGMYGNVLQAASVAGHKDIVQFLVGHGTAVNAQGGHYGNALQAALSSRSMDTIQVLLDNGADINAQGGRYGNALQAASSLGSKDIIQILLDNGADINAQGGRYGNALQGASTQGSKDIIQILLDNGADVNAQGGRYGNALQAASSQGSKDIIQILLDNGADTNAQGGYYGNALQAASASKSKDTVQVLLDNGADINAQGGEYGNALQAASSSGSEDIIQVLLDNGADINAESGDYGSALQAACSLGSEKMVTLLLDRGADVNAVGDAYSISSLQRASKKGHGNVVKMLLDRGADINASRGPWGSAVQAASKYGHKNILMTLLEKGADVNAVGDDCQLSALQLASRSGHQDIVTILLAKGAVMPEEEKGSLESHHEDGSSVANAGDFDSVEPLPSHLESSPALVE